MVIKLLVMVIFIAGCVYMPPKMEANSPGHRIPSSDTYVEVREYNEFGTYIGTKTLIIKRRNQP